MQVLASESTTMSPRAAGMQRLRTLVFPARAAAERCTRGSGYARTRSSVPSVLPSEPMSTSSLSGG